MLLRTLALTAVLVPAGSMSFAQATGAATYKAKCQMCHGATGAADIPVAKSMKVKPVADPEVKKLTLDEMCASVKNGKGKMPAFNGKLTERQIKEVTIYFRSLAR